MYQRDFVLRMIEMLAELVAGILGWIKKGKFDKAEEALEKVYYDFLKQDASFFRSIPIEELTYTLLKNHNYTNGHLEILAELFATEGALNKAKNQKELAHTNYQKALVLTEFIDKESGVFSLDRQNKMDNWKAKINELS